ncbi:hypothetical protein [Neisseria zoodegmatis]|nr:hypothetical protein [Neisseria zoodegmatis]
MNKLFLPLVCIPLSAALPLYAETAVGTHTGEPAQTVSLSFQQARNELML